jgi:hypothetical protein
MQLSIHYYVLSLSEDMSPGPLPEQKLLTELIFFLLLEAIVGEESGYEDGHRVVFPFHSSSIWQVSWFSISEQTNVQTCD